MKECNILRVLKILWDLTCIVLVSDSVALIEFVLNMDKISNGPGF